MYTIHASVSYQLLCAIITKHVSIDISHEKALKCLNCKEYAEELIINELNMPSKRPVKFNTFYIKNNENNLNFNI